MRFLLKALLIFGGVFVLTLIAVCLWTWLWPETELEAVTPSEAIICLGAGVDEAGRIDAAAMRRLETSIALFEAGVAPYIVLSSGAARPGGKSGAETMAEIAMAAGVPEHAIHEDRRAQSTLQNAIFSMDLIIGAHHVTLVTEAFHLPRSKASFLWAGAERVDLVMSERVRRETNNTERPSYMVLVREALAIWFNLTRAAFYTIGGWVGVAEADRIDWLH